MVACSNVHQRLRDSDQLKYDSGTSGDEFQLWALSNSPSTRPRSFRRCATLRVDWTLTGDHLYTDPTGCQPMSNDHFLNHSYCTDVNGSVDERPNAAGCEDWDRRAVRSPDHSRCNRYRLWVLVYSKGHSIHSRVQVGVPGLLEV